MAVGARLRPLGMAALALVALLAAFQVIRNAAVADRQARWALASALWPAHPSVLTDSALLEIAAAASSGQPVPQATAEKVRHLARRAPLSPDPFLIEAALAATAGRDRAVEPLLLGARERDPRSRGARFLLAERYLRSGRVAAGLVEMHSLIRLQSRGVELFAPSLAAYARTPGAVPEMRAFFARYPSAEAGVLSLLSLDAANADLVLELASNVRTPEPDWRATLVGSMVAAGQYVRAHEVWKRVSGIGVADGLFNADFAQTEAPPPFNWLFPQSSEGIAEPDGRGGLSVLYYGRSDAVLARQLLLLAPGRYRLASSVEASGSVNGVRWKLRCANGSQSIGNVNLKPGAVAAGFVVPASCDAQWLELEGVASEDRATVELTIRRLRLVAEGRI